MVKVRDHKYQFISARPFAPNLGAEIYDVDLSKKISDEQFSDIAQAFLDHQVLFLKIRKKFHQMFILLLVKDLENYMLILQHQLWKAIQKSLKFMQIKIRK